MQIPKSNFLKNYSEKIRSSIERILQERDCEGEVIKQSPIWVRGTVIGLMGSALFAVGWLAIAKTDEVVSVSGKLEPLGSVQNIQMPVGGIAEEILVKDGEAVTAGQIVMRLDAETTKQRLSTLQQRLKLKLRQLDLKEAELQQYFLLNSEETKMLENNLKLENKILSRFKSLASEGATSEIQYLQQKNRVNDIESKLSSTKLSRIMQEAAQNQQIQQIKSDLEDIQSGITEASVNLRYQVLRSPVDGIVFDLQPRGKGYAAQSTETVMKIVPRKTLEAKVEIPSSKIGFVKVGKMVELSIDSFPARDFGVLEGEVKSIGSDALPPNQQENRPEYRYPAIIKLANQQLKLKGNKELQLQVGMSLTSNIKLRKVSYLQLLLGTFKEKVDSLGKI